MVFGNGVRNIQAAAYNGARPVNLAFFYVETQKKSRFARPEIFLRFEADRDFFFKTLIFRNQGAD